MINSIFFFDNEHIQLFGGRLPQKQVNGLTAILNEWEKNYSPKIDR